MPALAQCEAYGVIYDQHGGAAIDTLVTLERVEEATGKAILLDPVETWTDFDGIFRFILPQNARAFISARATTLWDTDCEHGVEFLVPPAPTGPLAPILEPPVPADAFSVQPPLSYAGGVFSIARSSAGQDGYLAAEDYARFDEPSGDLSNYLPLTGGTLTGYLTLSGNPLSTFHAATKNYVDNEIIDAIAAISAGGVTSFNGRTDAVTLTGGDVNTALGYIPADTASLGSYLLLAGGTLTGALTLAADPTLPLQAATRQWVLAQVAGATAGVSSFAARTGVVVPLVGDYSAFYAATVHAHTRADISDLGVFSTSQPGLVPQPSASDAAKFLTGAGTWVAQAADAVTSVFTRTGAVVAASGDYSAFYAALSHTHLRANITDLGVFSTSQPGLVPQPTAGDAAKVLTGAGTWVAQTAVAPVTSVFTRTGAVVAASGDYSAFYAALSHTHTRSQITDLGIFSTSQPGLVPQPTSGDAAKFLTGEGTWAAASGSVDLTANYAWTGNHTFSQKIAVGGAIDANAKLSIVQGAGLSQFALAFNNGVDASVNFLTTAPGSSGNGNTSAKGRAYITAYGDFVMGAFTGYGSEPDYWLQCFDAASPPKRSTYVYGYSADANNFFTCGLGGGTNYFSVTTAGVVQLRSGAYLDLGPQKILQTAPSGGTLQIQQVEELLTLSTGALTTDTAGNLLPANSIILDVSIRITTTVTGSLTSWKVGDSAVADRFIPVTSVYTAGTTSVGLNHWLANRTTAGMGQAQAAAAKVRVTFIGQPTAGAMRITVRYISLTAATS